VLYIIIHFLYWYFWCLFCAFQIPWVTTNTITINNNHYHHHVSGPTQYSHNFVRTHNTKNKVCTQIIMNSHNLNHTYWSNITASTEKGTIFNVQNIAQALPWYEYIPYLQVLFYLVFKLTYRYLIYVYKHISEFKCPYYSDRPSMAPNYKLPLINYITIL
jgi:hypothetical protein